MNAEQDIRREAALLRSLLEQYAGEEDDPAMVECLANETELPRMIVRVLTLAREKAAFADALRAIIAEWRARVDRFDKAEERLRAIASQVMQETGLTKVAEPEMTVSMRPGVPSVITTAEPDESLAEFFPKFVREKKAYSFDTKALREALAAGEAIPFASLGNAAPSLTVRIK